MRYRLLLSMIPGLLLVTSLSAQDDLQAVLDARQKAIPKEKQVPRFTGRVVVFQDRPKERLEIRRVNEDQLEEPIVSTVETSSADGR